MSEYNQGSSSGYSSSSKVQAADDHHATSYGTVIEEPATAGSDYPTKNTTVVSTHNDSSDEDYDPKNNFVANDVEYVGPDGSSDSGSDGPGADYVPTWYNKLGLGGYDENNKKRLKPFAFIKTTHFWIILVHGQILSMCIVCTNTMTTYMANGGLSIPAFQSLFNYCILLLVFLPYTIYRQGFKNYVSHALIKNGWRWFILSFADSQGNYFIVKAYNYTNLLSASLLDNFTIVFVVLISYMFLRVRYHWTQVIGVVICIGGCVLLIVSDLITGKNYAATERVKGDLFVLLSTLGYGISNTMEEFLVSKRPIYEVLAQMGLFGTIIMGVECAIFERESLANAHWTPDVGGYLVGYTLALLLMYLTAPILLRMSSSAFYNLSLLTSDFWSLLIGIRVFGYYVFWLYPVGFVFTILGVVFYNIVPKSLKGESEKPWLGENQEYGIAGIGTAKSSDKSADKVGSDGGEILVSGDVSESQLENGRQSGAKKQPRAVQDYVKDFVNRMRK